MTQQTTFLKLKTYDTLTDASSVLIYNYIDETSGCSITSNIGILDNYASETSGSIINISASLSAVEQKIDTTKSAVIQIVSPSTIVDINGLFYLRIPSELNNLGLSRAQGFVNTASASGISASMTVQVRNMTKYPINDALSYPIVISSGCVVGTPGIVDESYNDVSTDDQVKIYVGDVSSGSPKGLQIVLEYK